MPIPYTRASRPWVFAPSAGASVLLKWYDTRTGQLVPSDGFLLDIDIGILQDSPINQDTTNSGDNGGSSFTRVGGLWRYRLSLSFPAALMETGGVTMLPATSAFIQQLLGTPRYVWMQFNMGDPEFWESAQNVRSFIGRRSLMEECETRVEMKKVIGLNVAGVGSSLLRAMVGNTQVYP